jgi:hypothetical protein
MARTIRLAGSSGGSGLSTTDVTSLIESNSRFVLDKNYVFTSVPSSPFTVIPSVDFENVAIYLIVGRGLTSSGGNDYRTIDFGGHNGDRSYYGNRGGNFYSGGVSGYSNGTFNLMPNGTDCATQGMGDFELKIFINEKGSPNNGSRRAKVHYTSEIPNSQGTQQHAANVHFDVFSDGDWQYIGVGMNNGTFGFSQYAKTASMTVYKQLRVPAS